MLEAWDGRDWKVITTGTTIGYKRILRFDDMSAKKVRLRITKSRISATLANFGLFYMPPITNILERGATADSCENIPRQM